MTEHAATCVTTRHLVFWEGLFATDPDNDKRLAIGENVKRRLRKTLLANFDLVDIPLVSDDRPWTLCFHTHTRSRNIIVCRTPLVQGYLLQTPYEKPYMSRDRVGLTCPIKVGALPQFAKRLLVRFFATNHVRPQRYLF
ncbi:hypothetical protein TWF132_010129 [Orbilia oligospora]|nr:hypothetical protein TWF132_010129 [Orbilia oligospora]